MSEQIDNTEGEPYAIKKSLPLIGLIGSEDIRRNMRGARIERVAIDVGRLRVQWENMPSGMSDLDRRAALLAALGVTNAQIGSRLEVRRPKTLISAATEALEISHRSGIGRRLFEIEALTVLRSAPTLRLSRYEKRVIDEISRGSTEKEASVNLELSPYTVKSHVSHVSTRSGFNGHEEIVLAAMTSGEIGDFVLRDLHPELYAQKFANQMALEDPLQDNK